MTRRDPLTGAPAVIVAGRQGRPNRPEAACPFCPGGLEAPEPYDTRWFPNRFPPLPDGRAEVVLYSPRHDVAMWELGVDGVRRVVDLWADRTQALGRRDDVSYVLCFENRGVEVGATIPHPHGQVFGFDEVPPAAAVELGGATCTLCTAPSAEHVVTSVGGCAAWVPAAATWPYELRIAPEAHLPDLLAADTSSRTALATVLVDVLERLDRLFASPMPYMLWLHQRPTDGGAWPTAHVHLHVAPLLRSPGVPRFVAAGELGSGVHFNPVDPADAAEALRSS